MTITAAQALREDVEAYPLQEEEIEDNLAEEAEIIRIRIPLPPMELTIQSMR